VATGDAVEVAVGAGVGVGVEAGVEVGAKVGVISDTSAVVVVGVV
jgi:hypothetical protein